MAKSVLIVDDCEDVAELSAFVLRREGFKVRWAADGAMGLATVAAWHPDLVVLDMMMPNVDGIEFLQRLPTVTREQPLVIAYSGFNGFERPAITEGASAFLRNPFESDVLIA